MELQNFFALDVNGNIVPGALCSLFLPGTTTLATGLQDINNVPLSNPFSADGNALVQFRAPNGAYDLKIEAGAITNTLRITCADNLQALAELAGFLGTHSAPPTVRADGTPLQLGDRYFDSDDDLEYLQKNSGWLPNNLYGQLIAEPGGAALIGTLQLGLGAIARTQADKNTETFSVKDFGAIGDGMEHPIYEWYTIGFAAYRGYADLAAVQVDYPFVTSGDDLIDWAAFEATLIAGQGKTILVPLSSGAYVKDKHNQIHNGTNMVGEPGAVIQRVGNLDSWMFVNGEVGNATYATGYDGDGLIRITGITFDLNGFPGRSAAAFVIGHSKLVVFEHCQFKRGYESHNIEMNSSTSFYFLFCTFEDQLFAGASSYEVINIDYAGMAGFPGWGVWDDTPDRTGLVLGCKFKNVHSGVCSHSVPPGVLRHRNIKVVFSTFEDIATKGIRGQGWYGCLLAFNTFDNIGQEAISLLTANNNRVMGNQVHGASTSANGLYSAIRIDGDQNICANQIDDGGYANKYAYAYGIAAGTRNDIDTTGAARGVSGLWLDSGTLNVIDKRVQLFSGNATGIGTTVTLLDSLNNYEQIEVSTGAVGSGFYQTGLSRPFSRRNWAVGTDFVALTTANGRVVASVTSLTLLTLTVSADGIRQIYGVTQ